VDKEQSASATAVAICAWLAAVLIVWPWPICRFPPVMACSSEKNTSPGWLKP
jgi:hypothetical protein